MIYCFDQCKLENLPTKHFVDLVDNRAKLLCASFENDNRGDIHLVHNKPIKDYNIDYDFILEYDIKRFSRKAAYTNTRPYINQIVSFALNFFSPKDIIIYPNSGSYIARALHETSFIKGYKFYYYENYYLSERYQISSIPFTRTSKYGDPEQLVKFKEAEITGEEEAFLQNLIDSKNTKYNDKQKSIIAPTGDILVVGQLSWDSNVILVDKQCDNTIELCKFISSKYPYKTILYKPHPIDNTFKKSDIEKLSNVIVTDAHIVDLINNVKEVHTISSTVGLEAELRDVKTIWYSDCFQREYKLYKNMENKLKFIRMSLDYTFKRDEFYNKIMK